MTLFGWSRWDQRHYEEAQVPRLTQRQARWIALRWLASCDDEQLRDLIDEQWRSRRWQQENNARWAQERKAS